LKYIPLGVGIVLPPVEFPLAIMAGMRRPRSSPQHGHREAFARLDIIAAKVHGIDGRDFRLPPASSIPAHGDGPDGSPRPQVVDLVGDAVPAE